MLNSYRIRLGFLFAALWSLPCSWLFADDKKENEQAKLFTQKPEIADSRVAGEPTETTKPKSSTAKKSNNQAIFKKGPTPEWIWGADTNQKYYLKTSFEGGSKAARIKASCDNHLVLYLNGKKIGQSGNWESPVEIDVQKHLKNGENEVIAEVKNAGGPSGFVLKLVLTMPDGSQRYVVSNKSWTAATTRDAEKWIAVRSIQKLGGGPWGNVFNKSVAPVSSTHNDFVVLPGFQVERLFTVPKPELGSWVSIAFDNKGRLIASDQGKQGLCRITPPPIGSDEPTKVERLDINITASQGMLYAFNSLYVSVNGGPGSGLYRARDTNGDDQYDEVVKLKSLRGGGEHGPHALRLSPDGKSIYMICGNHTDPPEEFDSSRIPSNWSEDHLLPRQWDANGHARGKLAPGGWIAKTDPAGKTWEMFSIGYRNPYDMDFNADGELFAYDADMEWDMGSPWYRPTRVVHATSGSEFGWRSGTGKWPTYFPDSLPELVDIGPGSPVGAAFGYGTKFPGKYQKAFFICDWTFGTMYAIHTEAHGASYKAVKEEFVSRSPLPLTDVAVGNDGALYFTIGGRGTQSELFRVTYVGDESTAAVEARDNEFTELRELRQKLERSHSASADSKQTVGLALANLGHQDRHIRYASRIALEHQPVELWKDAILSAADPVVVVTGVVGLARQGDETLQPKLLDVLDRIDFQSLDESQQLALLRAYQLVFVRLGEPDDVTRARIAEKLDPSYPATSDALNRELSRLLVYLNSKTVVRKTIPMLLAESKASDEDLSGLLARNSRYGGTVARILANAPDKQQIHYAFVLRNLKKGWTVEERKQYFQWFAKARTWSGGSSFQKFLTNIDNEAFANSTDAERLAVEAFGARVPYKAPELPKPVGPGQEWNVDDLLAMAKEGLTGRNFKNGKKMYSAARCVVCHRFAGDGGATGPDLTQLAGRFKVKDLSESLVDPSKVISDQYRASVIVTADGKVYTGRIVSETKDTIMVVTNPEDSTKVAEILREDIDDLQPSKVSLMPKDTMKALNKDEVLDLLAYLLSRGDQNSPMFRK